MTPRVAARASPRGRPDATDASRGFRAAVVLVLAVLASAPAAMMASPQGAGAEVELLLQRLAVSGCRFERNGSWHDAGDASRHLRHKLGQMQRRAVVESAEQFIRFGGEASSATGRPYLVRCADAPDIPSRDWLLQQLAVVRAQRAAPRP